MLPLTIHIHNTNALINSPIPTISLTHFLEKNFSNPIQSSFNRYARIPSLISNVFLWLAFLFAILVLQIGQDNLRLSIRILYGLIMLLIILICYVFILFESKGCSEQILLKKRLQIDMIKRELGLIEKTPKLTSHLTVTGTNYYNSLTGKYLDYQIYDQSLCIRLQSVFYRKIHCIEDPFVIRQYHIDIPDFSIRTNRLCQILFNFHLTIIGRDADVVFDDLEHEFQRLERALLDSIHDELLRENFTRLERQIYLKFDEPKQQDLFFGQRRTCLVYENKMKISYRWFLTENIFWIMTCVGLSWLFRAIFACLIEKVTVPVHIELEGAMPVNSHEKNTFE